MDLLKAGDVPSMKLRRFASFCPAGGKIFARMDFAARLKLRMRSNFPSKHPSGEHPETPGEKDRAPRVRDRIALQDGQRPFFGGGFRSIALCKRRGRARHAG